jgi:galactokinase
MTGGGFGGCVVVLVPEDAVDAIMTAIPIAVREAGFDRPTVVRVVAAAGACEVSPDD